MGNTRVKLNYGAFKAFRQSPEVVAAVNAEAQAMAVRANQNRHISSAQYEAVPAQDSKQGTVALVHTGNKQAKLDQNKYGTLERSIGG